MNHFKNINCKTCQGKKFSKKSNESEIVRKINIKNDFNQKNSNKKNKKQIWKMKKIKMKWKINKNFINYSKQKKS